MGQIVTVCLKSDGLLLFQVLLISPCPLLECPKNKCIQSFITLARLFLLGQKLEFSPGQQKEAGIILPNRQLFVAAGKRWSQGLLGISAVSELKGD